MANRLSSVLLVSRHSFTFPNACLPVHACVRVREPGGLRLSAWMHRQYRPIASAHPIDQRALRRREHRFRRHERPGVQRVCAYVRHVMRACVRKGRTPLPNDLMTSNELIILIPSSRVVFWRRTTTRVRLCGAGLCRRIPLHGLCLLWPHDLRRLPTHGGRFTSSSARSSVIVHARNRLHTFGTPGHSASR